MSVLTDLIYGGSNAVAGLTGECYIDGIRNKESAEDWLTEIQLPVR